MEQDNRYLNTLNSSLREEKDLMQKELDTSDFYFRENENIKQVLKQVNNENSKLKQKIQTLTSRLDSKKRVKRYRSVSPLPDRMSWTKQDFDNLVSGKIKADKDGNAVYMPNNK